MGFFDAISKFGRQISAEVSRPGFLEVLGAVEAGVTGGSPLASAEQARRQGREVIEDAKRREAAIILRAREENRLRAITARRAASSQLANIGASGVTGTPLTVIQETLTLALEEIQFSKAAAKTQADRVARLGRQQAKALITQARTQAFGDIVQSLIQQQRLERSREIPQASSGTKFTFPESGAGSPSSSIGTSPVSGGTTSPGGSSGPGAASGSGPSS